MKSKTWFLAGFWLWLATVTLAAASNSDGILIKGKVRHDSGQGFRILRATIVCGDTEITAAEIVFDRSRNALRCVGEATQRNGGLTVQTKDFVIEIGNRRVFMLVPGVISIARPATISGAKGQPGGFQEATIPIFRAPGPLLPRN